MSIPFDVVGDGEPLLLLAGQAKSRQWWDPVCADLAARHRTIALDALGTRGERSAGRRGVQHARVRRGRGGGAGRGRDRPGARVCSAGSARRPWCCTAPTTRVLPPGNADLLVAGIRGAALQLFEGARHAYFLEHLAAASAAVLAHLAARPLRG